MSSYMTPDKKKKRSGNEIEVTSWRSPNRKKKDKETMTNDDQGHWPPWWNQDGIPRDDQYEEEEALPIDFSRLESCKGASAEEKKQKSVTASVMAEIYRDEGMEHQSEDDNNSIDSTCFYTEERALCQELDQQIGRQEEQELLDSIHKNILQQQQQQQQRPNAVAPAVTDSSTGREISVTSVKLGKRKSKSKRDRRKEKRSRMAENEVSRKKQKRNNGDKVSRKDNKIASQQGLDPSPAGRRTDRSLPPPTRAINVNKVRRRSQLLLGTQQAEIQQEDQLRPNQMKRVTCLEVVVNDKKLEASETLASWNNRNFAELHAVVRRKRKERLEYAAELPTTYCHPVPQHRNYNWLDAEEGERRIMWNTLKKRSKRIVTATKKLPRKVVNAATFQEETVLPYRMHLHAQHCTPYFIKADFQKVDVTKTTKRLLDTVELQECQEEPDSYLLVVTKGQEETVKRFLRIVGRQVRYRALEQASHDLLTDPRATCVDVLFSIKALMDAWRPEGAVVPLSRNSDENKNKSTSIKTSAACTSKKSTSGLWVDFPTLDETDRLYHELVDLFGEEGIRRPGLAVAIWRIGHTSFDTPEEWSVARSYLEMTGKTEVIVTLTLSPFTKVRNRKRVLSRKKKSALDLQNVVVDMNIEKHQRKKEQESQQQLQCEKIMDANFRKKYLPVYEIEHGASDVTENAFLDALWRNHNLLQHDVPCDEYCKCASNPTALASEIGGSPAGFLDCFVKRFMPRYRFRFHGSGETDAQILDRLIYLWRLHAANPLLGKKCGRNCPCYTSLAWIESDIYGPGPLDTDSVLSKQCEVEAAVDGFDASVRQHELEVSEEHEAAEEKEQGGGVKGHLKAATRKNVEKSPTKRMSSDVMILDETVEKDRKRRSMAEPVQRREPPREVNGNESIKTIITNDRSSMKLLKMNNNMPTEPEAQSQACESLSSSDGKKTPIEGDKKERSPADHERESELASQQQQPALDIVRAELLSNPADKKQTGQFDDAADENQTGQFDDATDEKQKEQNEEAPEKKKQKEQDEETPEQKKQKEQDEEAPEKQKQKEQDKEVAETKKEKDEDVSEKKKLKKSVDEASHDNKMRKRDGIVKEPEKGLFDDAAHEKMNGQFDDVPSENLKSSGTTQKRGHTGAIDSPRLPREEWGEVGTSIERFVRGVRENKLHIVLPGLRMIRTDQEVDGENLLDREYRFAKHRKLEMAKKMLKIYKTAAYALQIARTLGSWSSFHVRVAKLTDVFFLQEPQEGEQVTGHLMSKCFGVAPEQRASFKTKLSRKSVAVDYDSEFSEGSFHYNVCLAESRECLIELRSTRKNTVLASAVIPLEDVSHRCCVFDKCAFIEKAMKVGEHLEAGAKIRIRAEKAIVNDHYIETKKEAIVREMTKAVDWIERFNAENRLPTSQKILADIRALDGFSLLHAAVVCERPALIEKLLSLGANPHETSDNHDTPSVFARKKYDLVNAQVRRSGSNLAGTPAMMAHQEQRAKRLANLAAVNKLFVNLSQSPNTLRFGIGQTDSPSSRTSNPGFSSGGSAVMEDRDLSVFAAGESKVDINSANQGNKRRSNSGQILHHDHAKQPRIASKQALLSDAKANAVRDAMGFAVKPANGENRGLERSGQNSDNPQPSEASNNNLVILLESTWNEHEAWVLNAQVGTLFYQKLGNQDSAALSKARLVAQQRGFVKRGQRDTRNKSNPVLEGPVYGIPSDSLSLYLCLTHSGFEYLKSLGFSHKSEMLQRRGYSQSVMESYTDSLYRNMYSRPSHESFHGRVQPHQFRNPIVQKSQKHQANSSQARGAPRSSGIRQEEQVPPRWNHNREPPPPQDSQLPTLPNGRYWWVKPHSCQEVCLAEGCQCPKSHVQPLLEESLLPAAQAHARELPKQDIRYYEVPNLKTMSVHCTAVYHDPPSNRYFLSEGGDGGVKNSQGVYFYKTRDAAKRALEVVVASCERLGQSPFRNDFSGIPSHEE